MAKSIKRKATFSLQEAAAKEHGFVLTGHHLELFGICPSCQRDVPDETVRTLEKMKPGTTARIKSFVGEAPLLRRLRGYGLREGRTIKLVRFAPFNGPVLVEDLESEARLMIALEMASHVVIEGDDGKKK